MRYFVTLAALLLSLTIIAVAQNQPLAFEVAAIKPSKVEDGSSGILSGNGRIYGHNVTLKRCIIGAYGVRSSEIIGGPDWLDSERVEITAKGEPLGERALMRMLQTLLADRFKLALHHEMKRLDGYALEVNNGRKLEKADGKVANISNGRGHIVATNFSMVQFAEVLSRQVDLPVFNRTGLDGVFNIDLQWTPGGDRPARPDDLTPFDGLTIFTAIQEQLGLRLHAQRVPVDVIVIDHAEKPSRN
jgi:uncharacterized protein (TIGR03435 family)